MELRHLRYFAAVAEEQNVTRAAARLHLSQPALSRQIRDLEEEMGIALFDHGAKALHLTEAGKAFLIETRAVLKRLNEAVRMAKAVANGQSGEIHVGYAPSLAVELLPRILRTFQERHPGVRVHLHDKSTQEMLRGLRDGSLHLALLVRVSPKVMSDLVFEELGSHPVCVALHPEHPLAKLKNIGLKHLVDERLIAFTLADYPEHHAWIAGLFEAFPHPPRIAEEHDSATSLIAAVEAGRGVALVSQSLDCLTGGRLSIRPLHPAPPPLVIGAASRHEPLSLVAERFMDATRTAARE